MLHKVLKIIFALLCLYLAIAPVLNYEPAWGQIMAGDLTEHDTPFTKTALEQSPDVQDTPSNHDIDLEPQTCQILTLPPDSQAPVIPKPFHTFKIPTSRILLHYRNPAMRFSSYL